MIRLSGPNPAANVGASLAGVVAGVTSANSGSGGVALNNAFRGSAPCAYSWLIGVVLGSRDSMPVAYCASKTSVGTSYTLPYDL